MGENEKVDAVKLGMKSGLEIHQQLDTLKLFCNCPSLLRKDEPDFKIKRKLHVVAGESGEVDVAAVYEASKDKEFIYEGYESTCLVELDEEPPHEMNKEALKIAVHMALLLNCTIIPVAQIMRKTVIDGSNTSGFQRTVLIARDGWIETSQGKVGIDTICLEEDSARIVSKGEGQSVFRIDRLGIPLVEIATAADIKTPEQAKETALMIGELLRTCKVKRGIGTIRQDINISIKGSNRVELKGFQDPKIMIKTVELELLRQKKIIDTGKINEKEVRNVLPNGESEFLRPMPGSARMYPETDLPLLKISREFINEAKKTLPRSRKEVEMELRERGLNENMITEVFREQKLEEFTELSKIIKNPQLIFKILLMWPKEISSKKGLDIEKINEILTIDVLSDLLNKMKKGEVNESDVKTILDKMVSGEDLEKAVKIEKADVNEIENFVRKIISEKPGLSDKAYMGLAMAEFKGKVQGKDLLDIIKRYIK